MHQAASVYGLAIEEPPVSPAREKGSRRLAPVEAARERLPRFHHHSTQPVGAQVEVTLRLIGGEKIGVGTFETEESAKEHAHALTQELSSAREWLFFNGRFVRPDAVVSVDLNTY